MMETWQELKVTVKREGEELVSNLLTELGAQGVAIKDSFEEAVLFCNRAKEMGFDATRLFEERLTNLIAQNEVPNA